MGRQKSDLDLRCRGVLLSGAAIRLVLGLGLALRAPVWGQDGAQPAPAGKESPSRAAVQSEPVVPSGGTLRPSVTPEGRGRLLFLRYRLAGTGQWPNAGTLGQAPRFTVYKGQRKIASGRFEYERNGTCGYAWRVPVTSFGDLRIVPSANFGETGWIEGNPVLYHWPWYWHLPTFGPWLLLAIGIVLPRTNRNRQAVLILIPMLIFHLLWGQATKSAGLSSTSREEFRLLCEPLMVGAALLWINADKFGRYHGVMWFTGSLAVILLADFVAVLSYGRTFSGARIEVPAFLAIMGIALLVALALTRLLVHKRYDPLRFMLWLAAWSTLCSLAGMTAFWGVVKPEGAHAIHNLQSALVQVVVPGAVCSLCLYAVNLPYLLLMFTSPFFRRRFHIWLGAAES